MCPAKRRELTDQEQKWLMDAARCGLPLNRIAECLIITKGRVEAILSDLPDVMEARRWTELEAWGSVTQAKEWRAKAWVLLRMEPATYGEQAALKTAIRALAREHGIPLDQLAADLSEADRRREEEE
jgi:hypothetical protein